LLTVALVIAAACNNGYPVAPLSDGDAACADLVQYCAAPAAAVGEPYQSCYDTGMRGKANACLDVADECVKPCRDADVALPATGEGGAPGAAGSNGGAGEASGAGNLGAGEPGESPGGAGGAAGR
jgi:hypothetical protein